MKLLPSLLGLSGAIYIDSREKFDELQSSGNLFFVRYGTIWCSQCQDQLINLFSEHEIDSHAVGMDSWVQMVVKSIFWETLFVDQLHFRTSGINSRTSKLSSFDLIWQKFTISNPDSLGVKDKFYFSKAVKTKSAWTLKITAQIMHV